MPSTVSFTSKLNKKVCLGSDDVNRQHTNGYCGMIISSLMTLLSGSKVNPRELNMRGRAGKLPLARRGGFEICIKMWLSSNQHRSNFAKDMTWCPCWQGMRRFRSWLRKMYRQMENYDTRFILHLEKLLKMLLHYFDRYFCWTFFKNKFSLISHWTMIFCKGKQTWKHISNKMKEVIHRFETILADSHL